MKGPNKLLKTKKNENNLICSLVEIFYIKILVIVTFRIYILVIKWRETKGCNLRVLCILTNIFCTLTSFSDKNGKKERMHKKLGKNTQQMGLPA